MNIKEMLARLVAERDVLMAAAAAGELTEEQTARAVELAAEHARLTQMQANMDAAAQALAGIASVEVNEPEPPQAAPRSNQRASLGERFVASDAFGSFKAATGGHVADGTTVNIRMAATVNRESTGSEKAAPEWTDDLTYRAPRTLMDLITKGTTGKSYLPYRQLVAVENNAAVVGEAKTNDGTTAAQGFKPTSTLTFLPGEAKVADYADGTEVTNQELEDDGAIKAIIDSNLTANLEDRIQDLLLNGDGVGLNPKGLLNTTGVQQQAFTTDMATSVRKAFTKLYKVGANVQAVLLNPEDDEAWDLLKDLEGRYMGAGPFASGPNTAWSAPRIGCNAVPVGRAVAGDFKTIHFLERRGIEILVFNQHKDYAQRNLNYIRAEMRAMQLFRAPGKLISIDLAAG